MLYAEGSHNGTLIRPVLVRVGKLGLFTEDLAIASVLPRLYPESNREQLG
jgi:hypothetical protein